VFHYNRPFALPNVARWSEFIVSPVGVNERLAGNHFTVPPLLVETASSSAGSNRA
jgi:hypothetical protein